MKFKPVLFFYALLLSTTVFAQTITLPRSIPEKQGVSSKAILSFLDATEKSRTEFHSFMLVRHGKVVAEGWWNPYRADLKHTMYSCSKSFTATAVGFAVQEKKLTLNNKVVSFFPQDLPDTVSAYLADLTVRDVLIMSDGQDPDPTYKIGRDSNWVRAFLTTPIVNKPGTKFLYNTLGTFMLSAIVQKATGQRILDYLKPRLFDPLGIEGMDWEMDTRGTNTGGWGLRVKTEDMAKFAQLFLQKGNWKGRQILPASWMEEASALHILQNPNASQAARDSSDWLQGYGYQMWRSRNNSYRGDGAFGQFMIVMPEKDAVLAITAETPDMQEELNLVWKYLLPAFHNGRLNKKVKDYRLLRKRLKTLALPPAAGAPSGGNETARNKIFSFEPNKEGLRQIAFSFTGNACNMELVSDTATHLLVFGNRKWSPSFTNKPGPSLTGAAFEDRSMLYPAKTEGSYAWKNANTLQLVLRYIESPHTETYTCRFSETGMEMELDYSFGYGKAKTLFKAKSK